MASRDHRARWPGALALPWSQPGWHQEECKWLHDWVRGAAHQADQGVGEGGVLGAGQMSEV